MRSKTLLIPMRYDSFVWDMTHPCETWLIRMRHDSSIWDMTHPYETWLIHMRHDSFVRDMTHLDATWLIYMRHDSSVCEMTHSYETWLIRPSDMTLSYDPSMCANVCICTYKYIMHIYIYTYVYTYTYIYKCIWPFHVCTATHWYDSLMCVSWLITVPHCCVRHDSGRFHSMFPEICNLGLVNFYFRLAAYIESSVPGTESPDFPMLKSRKPGSESKGLLSGSWYVLEVSQKVVGTHTAERKQNRIRLYCKKICCTKANPFVLDKKIYFV